MDNLKERFSGVFLARIQRKQKIYNNFLNLDTVEEKVNEMVDLKLCRTHQRRRTENIRKDVKRC